MRDFDPKCSLCQRPLSEHSMDTADVCNSFIKDEPAEPQTDSELMAKLNALYAASEHSGGARDDFWDCVSYHIGWLLALASRGAGYNPVYRYWRGSGFPTYMAAGALNKVRKFRPIRRS